MTKLGYSNGILNAEQINTDKVVTPDIQAEAANIETLTAQSGNVTSMSAETMQADTANVDEMNAETVTIVSATIGGKEDKSLDNPEFLQVVTDKNGVVILGIQVDGNLYFGAGVPRQIQDAIKEIAKDVDLSSVIALINAETQRAEGAESALQTAIDNKTLVVGYGEITQQMLSQEVIALINSAGGGVITNNADGEDLQTATLADGVTQVLKLADKTYNQSSASGMGRYFVRKNSVGSVNIITSAMLPYANTIYIIQYDHTISGGTLTIPSNSTLLFMGGKIKGGSIAFNNTLICGTDNCLEDVVCSGTIRNDYAYSGWFVNGTDYSQNYLNLFALGKDVRFRKDTYTLTSSVIDNKKCTHSVDFGGSTLSINMDSLHCRMLFSNSTPVNMSSDADVLAAIRNRARQFPVSCADSLLVIYSDEVELYRTSNASNTVPYYDSPQYKQEYLYIDKDGERLNDFFSSSITPSSVYIYPNMGMGKVCNATINISDGYTQSTDEHRRIGLYISEAMNYTVEGINFNCDIEDYYCIYNTVSCGYNIVYRNCEFASTTTNKDVYSYVFNARGIVGFYMDKVNCADVQADGWGTMATNYITDWKISNCRFNRIDAHMRVNNLYISDCIIGRKGIGYTGHGVIDVKDCIFMNCPSLLNARLDYMAFFDGDVYIRDCVAYGCTKVMDASFKDNDYQLGSHGNYIGARKLLIDNLSVYSERNTDILSLLTISDIDSEYISGKRMPNIIAANVTHQYVGANGYLINMPVSIMNKGYYFKNLFGNSSVRFIAENIDFVGGDLFSGTISQSDYASKASEYPTIDVAMKNCVNIKTASDVNNLTLRQDNLCTTI